MTPTPPKIGDDESGERELQLTEDAVHLLGAWIELHRLPDRPDTRRTFPGSRHQRPRAADVSDHGDQHLDHLRARQRRGRTMMDHDACTDRIGANVKHAIQAEQGLLDVCRTPRPLAERRQSDAQATRDSVANGKSDR